MGIIQQINAFYEKKMQDYLVWNSEQCYGYTAHGDRRD